MPTASGVQRPRNIEQTKERLRALAEAGAPPKVLEVLRSLRPHLIECIERKVKPGRILSTLQDEGWPFSRAGFYVAWHRFLEESGYQPRKRIPFFGQSPRGSIELRRPTLTAPNLSDRGKASKEALDVLARPSVTELLSKHGL